MPVGEDFWNPYRWVTLSNDPVAHDEPHYHHTFSGLSGRLWCELEALTPLLIGDGQTGDIQFVRHKHNQQPYIPGTSLKGAIRSLAEVVGNGTVPFSVSVERRHQPANARQDHHGVSQLDTITRTFGYFHQDDRNVFAGLIHFSDAAFATSPQSHNNWERYRIVVGQPKSSHRGFYPGRNKRKFYHHHPGVQQLVKALGDVPQGPQTPYVTPAPPGTSFHFTVDFTNLHDDELNLLLYCLALEEQVTVTLSPEALGRDAGSEELEGPLRHKIGGAKPRGAGSVHIRITKMKVCRDATARYRGGNATDIWEEPDLACEINRRTARFRSRTDLTMRELRAMLIYSNCDPRRPIRYPCYDWFKDERDHGLRTELKPTL